MRKERTPRNESGQFYARPLPERFADKYQIHESGCWVWKSTSSKESGGRRAQIRKDGKYVYAARVSYEMHKGEIPNGMQVLHRCDNPMCVNPEHLFIGTNRDNVIDAIEKGRFTQHIDNLESINSNRRKNHA